MRDYWIVLGLLCWLIPAAWAAERHLTVIVDTSTSMQDSDPRRYTLQSAQILSDLLDTGDSLTVIRMPQYDRACTDRADATLARQLDPADHSGFKQELDELLVYNTGTTEIGSIAKRRSRHYAQSLVAGVPEMVLKIGEAVAKIGGDFGKYAGCGVELAGRQTEIRWCAVGGDVEETGILPGIHEQGQIIRLAGAGRVARIVDDHFRIGGVAQIDTGYPDDMIGGLLEEIFQRVVLVPDFPGIQADDDLMPLGEFGHQVFDSGAHLHMATDTVQFQQVADIQW